MKTVYFALLVLIIVNSVFSKNLIYGVVKNIETNESLPHANIYIENTYIGTVSNDSGFYSIEITTVPSKVVVSYIGFDTEIIFIDQLGRNKRDVFLKPVILESSEIVITASREDPAIGIMKKVIANKIKWKNKLRSYKAKAYTRARVENDSSIVSLSESTSELYWHFEKGPREQFIAKQSSKRMSYLTEMNVGSKNIINLYQDNILLLNHSFFGPTHPDAIDYYNFELTGERYRDSTKVYDIKMTPKSNLQPLFRGEISVLDQYFAMIDVDLKISENISISEMIKYFQGNYKQQFNNFGKDFWLLIDSRVQEIAEVDMGLLAFPKALFNKISRISNYEINIDVSKDITRIDTTKTANIHEPLDSQKNSFLDFEKVPLTKRELDAYNNPDTTMTLIKSFPPTGLLAPMVINKEYEFEKALSEHSDYTILPSKTNFGFQGWYNRVEELNLGINFSYNFLKNQILEIETGYQTGTKRIYFDTQLQHLFNSEEQNTYAWIGYYNKINTRYSSPHYSQLFTSFLPLFGVYDYFDYYRNRKFYTGFQYEFANVYHLINIELATEDNSSINKTSNCNFLNSGFNQRPNPAINDGRINSIKLRYTYDESATSPDIAKLAGLEGYNLFEFQVEHSSAKYLISDFDFTQYKVLLDYQLNTFFKRRLDCNYFHIRMDASMYSGDLPLQRFDIIDGNIYSYSPFGIFKTAVNRPIEGEKKFGLFWEHNFKSIPFEFLGLNYFAKNKYEFIIQGASGRTWIEKNRLNMIKKNFIPVYFKKFHHEFGFAFKLKFKFIAVRLDAIRNLGNNNNYIGFQLNLIGMSF